MFMKNNVKKKKFEMPSSITILILLTIIMAILTHLIPAGQYVRVDNVPIAGQALIQLLKLIHKEYGIFWQLQ